MDLRSTLMPLPSGARFLPVGQGRFAQGCPRGGRNIATVALGVPIAIGLRFYVPQSSWRRRRAPQARQLADLLVVLNPSAASLRRVAVERFCRVACDWWSAMELPSAS